MSAKEEGKQSPGSVLILGRFGFDGDKLEKSGLFEYVDYGNKLRSVKYPKLNMTFMTAHASKGLGYDNVIVINGKNELYGFPSKIEDDPVLSFVIKGDHSIDYAEERRLFYVAMTRTKNRVYFIAPEHNPSEFLLEIKKEYKNVSLKGNWSEENPKLTNKKTCPICGFPMQYKYKNAYGLRLFICTNEPEICGFMTNEYNAGKLSICKCEKCRDGYLIVRPSKDTYFLGCTNFEESGTGCRNTLSAEEYYKMMKYPLTDLPKRPVREKRQVPTRELVNNPQETSVLPQDDTENINVIENDDGEVIYNNIPLRKTVIAVSNCLERISKVHFFGIVMLTDVLRGIETDRIKKYMFSSVPEFGVLENISRDNVSSIIQFLIDNDFILLTKGTYPVLHPTYNSRNLNETLTRNTLKKLATYLSKE